MTTAPTTPRAASPDAPATAPFRAILRTEARLFLREPMAWFWVVAFPTVLLVIFGFIPSFREPQDDLGGRGIIHLYVPICILLAMIMACSQTMPSTIIDYRAGRILRRLRTTPAGPGAIIGAQTLIYGVSILLATALCLTLGVAAYGVGLPENLVGWLVSFLLALAASLATGAVIAALCRTVTSGQVVGMLVMFPSMFTAGVWLPVQAMPDVLQRIVQLTPMGAAVTAMDDAAVGAFPAAGDLAVVAVWTVLLGAVAARTFRWE